MIYFIKKQHFFAAKVQYLTHLRKVFLTILWIPAWIVSIKLAKIIILPIWVKVVTKKEYIQEVVKNELKKQGVQNTNIENKYIEKETENNNRITDNYKKEENITYIKQQSDINADDIFKPFRTIFFILFNIIYITIAYKAISRFNHFDKNFYSFLSIILLIILIIQTALYIITKFKLQEKIEILRIKYNYEILLFIISIVYVILANIFILIFSFNESSNILVLLTSLIGYNLLFLFYHYLLMILSFKNFGWFEWLIKELDKYKEIEQIKEYVTQIQDYIIKYNEKRKLQNSDTIITNEI